MGHGLDTGALSVVAGCVVVWGLVSARSERLNVSAPIAFVVLGLVVAHGPISLISVQLHNETFRSIAEVTLALVLFSDASRVNVRRLAADVAIPARLLLIGLPLTIGLGTAVALVAFGGINPWVAAVIGAAVAPTDAALGAPIMEDRRIPSRVRRILNVESGLNDGIATPFVTFFIAGAVAEMTSHTPTAASALADLGIGVLFGVAIGGGGRLLLDLALDHGWGLRTFRPLAVLGLALLAYAAAIELGGANGFIAAFVGGLAFGSVHSERAEAGEPATPNAEETMLFIEDAGGFLSLLVWFLFGAAMVVPALENLTWEAVLFALLALTLVRMVPVGFSLLRSGLTGPTVALIGWFGPRGLASIVFCLIAVDALHSSDGQLVLVAVTVTVLASVLAHGVTAAPFARRYAHHSAGLPLGRAEHSPQPELPTRSGLAVRRRRRFR
jgi:NhaP-type Na+/H+ or K+/H+ antiporter